MRLPGHSIVMYALPWQRYRRSYQVWLNPRCSSTAAVAEVQVSLWAYPNHQERCLPDNIPSAPWTRILCRPTWRRRRPSGTKRAVKRPDSWRVAWKAWATRWLPGWLGRVRPQVLSRMIPTAIFLIKNTVAKKIVRVSFYYYVTLPTWWLSSMSARRCETSNSRDVASAQTRLQDK